MYRSQHYIPTLFATLGLEDEMACDSWGVAAMDWGNGGHAHPKSFSSEDIFPQLIDHLRCSGGALASQKTAEPTFLWCKDMPQLARVCGDLFAVSYLPRFSAMTGEPKLTARKFTPESAGAVLHLFEDCGNGLNMLGSRACRGN